MEIGLPKLTLFWMYDGEDAKARLSSIYSLDYPEFNVVIADGTQTLMELGTHIADDSELCVFWADDGNGPPSPATACGRNGSRGRQDGHPTTLAQVPARRKPDARTARCSPGPFCP